MFVDSNIIIDVVTNDPAWFTWSIGQLDAAALVGPLFINNVVLAEVCARYESIELVEELFAGMNLAMRPIPRFALFLASKAFVQYRKSGGQKTNVLTDFFIGAHATVLGMLLLTRDARRYRSYFPQLELSTP